MTYGNYINNVLKPALNVCTLFGFNQCKVKIVLLGQAKTECQKSVRKLKMYQTGCQIWQKNKGITKMPLI